MGKKGSVVIGYKYKMGIHMGISRGPVNALVAIKVGDRYAFSENEDLGIDSIKSNQTLTIAKPDLFGGEKKEGGIEGDLDVMMGDWGQGINTRLESMLGGLVPAFRRMFTVFFDGVICAMNPYPKTWAFRVRRSTAGWSGPTFYPEKCAVYLKGPTVPDGFEGSKDIHAMNGAHILYECATNTEWGRGHPENIINVPSFIDAANTLCAEGFGLCLRWVRQDDLDAFVQTVLDHIGGVLYEDRQTGKITLDLIRAPTTGETIPVVDETTGLLAVEDADTSATDTAINEFIVKYHDPVFNEDRSVRAQNIGNQQAVQAVYSATKDYPGIPTAELAARIAVRDLKALGLPLKRFKITMDRRAWKIRPASVFTLNAPDFNVTGMRVRVGAIEDGPLEQGTVVLTVIQDVFSFPDTTYIDVQQPGWTPPTTAPIPPVDHTLMEGTWRDLVLSLTTAELGTVDPSSGVFAAIARKPTAMATGYEVWLDPTGGSTFTKAADANFAPAITISDRISAYERTIYYTTSSDLGSVDVGSAGLIGGEIVRVDAIDTAHKKITVSRGCVDSIPAEHVAGTPMFFFDSFYGSDRREYAASEVLAVAYRTKAAGGLLALAAAPVDTVTIQARQNKPYPPANLKVNGDLVVGLPNAIGDMAFTWAHRDRLGQADHLLGTTEASTGPESGTTYTVRAYKMPANTLVHTESAISGTSWTYTASAMQADTGVTGAQALRFEVESVRSSIVSYQKYDFSFGWLPSTATGFGLDFGNNFGG